MPLARNADVGVCRAALDGVLRAVEGFSPGLLVLSFGADIFKDDPICGFRLKSHDFERAAEDIAACALPTVIVMEGGYAVGDLGRNVATFLSGWR